MNIIEKISKAVLEKQVNSVDEWLTQNGVTMDNISKFKLHTTHGIPEFIREDTKDGISIKGKSNTRYDLYPARGRNAKKIISSLYI